jgi:hypothetical protein
MNTADMTPVEIDTVLSENYEQQMRLQIQIAAEVRHLEHSEARLVRHDSDYNRDLVLRTRQRITVLQGQRGDLIAAAVPYLGEYNRRPWNRYFLVKNTNGHVHRGMNCSTCFSDTQYGWLVELADCDEDAMIEEWGERACTVCFPSAPSNPLFNRPARIDREAREAKDAEKAAKAAEKAEKAITDIDGSPLRVEGDELRTKVAARNEMSRQVQNGVWYGPKTEAIRKLAIALDAAGVPWHSTAEKGFKKAVKEATAPHNNPYRLTDEQIAETQAEFARNIVTTTTLLKELGVID